MSTEKAMKYIKGKMTLAEFEKQENELRNIQVFFETPIFATGSLIPLGAKIKELEWEKEERRHQEILEVIEGKQKEEIPKPEPWQLSKLSKRERDRLIWELRIEGATWEYIAEKADCGISTAKDNFEIMKTRLISG